MKAELRRQAPRWYPLWIYQLGVNGYFWPVATRYEGQQLASSRPLEQGIQSCPRNEYEHCELPEEDWCINQIYYFDQPVISSIRASPSGWALIVLLMSAKISGVSDCESRSTKPSTTGNSVFSS